MADRYTSFQARQQMGYLLPRFLAKYPEYGKPPAGKSLCRLAGLIDGREQWHPWRPISAYADLLADAAKLNASPACHVTAWVETR